MTLAFESLSATTAPVAARGILTASERQFGFLPSPVARAAHAPGVLAQLLASFAAFDRTSLTPLEREVIAMTVAFEHGCHYCMAMHTALQAGEPSAQDVVGALRRGSPLPVARLEALRGYARALVIERGHVPAPVAEAFTAVGFTEPQALEVVLGVATYTLSTFLNLVTDAPLDAPFRAFAWERPAD